ncbi:MAG: hypothetical protein Q4A44_02895 [Bacteroidales bacterium]|nr:hypothetical protein [Bacteroidales bacterium]
MMKQMMLTTLALVMAGGMAAQNGLITKAEVAMNEGKLDMAETTINEALASGKTKDMVKAHLVLGNIKVRQASADVDLAVKKQPFDTVAFYDKLMGALNGFEQSYKLDNTPDEKGRVKAKHLAEQAKGVKSIATYFVYAGQWFNASKDFARAFKAFKAYGDIFDSPVLSAEREALKAGAAETLTDVNFYAVIMASQAKDYAGVLEVVDRSLAAGEHLNELYMFKLNAQEKLGKTVERVETLKEAMERVADNMPYINELIGYYSEQGDSAAVRKLGNDLVSSSPNTATPLLVRAVTINQNFFKDNVAAREDLNKVLEIEPNNAKALASVAIVIYNDVLDLTSKMTTDSRSKAYQQAKAVIRTRCEEALPYAEKARANAPDEPKIWANILRNLYYELGQNDKGKEMTELLNTLTSK